MYRRNQIRPRATPGYETIVAKAGATAFQTATVSSVNLNLTWDVGDTVVIVATGLALTTGVTVSIPGITPGAINLESIVLSAQPYLHIFTLHDSPIAFSGAVTVARTSAGHMRAYAQVYSGVGRILGQNSQPPASNDSLLLAGEITTLVPNTWVLGAFGYYLNGNPAAPTLTSPTRLVAGTTAGTGYLSLMLTDMIAPTPGNYQASLGWTPNAVSWPVFGLGLEPRAIASPGVVTPGSSAVSNTATGSISVPITLADDDTVILICHTGSGTGTSPQDTLMSPTGPGNQTWEFLGQPPLAGLAIGAPQLWIIRKAVAASGNIILTRAGGLYLIALAQIYKNVDQVIGAGIEGAFESLNPAMGPSSTSYFNVTIPGSVGVTAFSLGFGNNNGLSFPGVRALWVGTAQAIYISDQTFAATGQQQLSQPWSYSSGTPNYRQLSVLLVPEPAGPTPDFTLSSSVPSLSVNQGASSQVVVTVNPTGGFANPVNLQVTGLPSGVTASWSSNPATTSSTLTLTAGSGATLGLANLTIIGTSGSLSDSIPISLTVNQGGVTPPPDAINDLSSRQWVLGIPTPFNQPNSILWHGEIKIRQLAFHSYASPGDVCIVKDRNGRVVWEATGSEGMQPIRSGNIGWIDGFVLDTLGSGLCIAYIK